MPVPYESFRYIHSQDHNCEPSEVLENKYKTVSELNGRFVTYAHGGGYRVYPNVAEFISHFKLIPECERMFHEVIFNQPQKLKFDIDIAASELDKFILPQVEEQYQVPAVSINDTDILSLMAEFIDPQPKINISANEAKYRDIFDTIAQAIHDAFFITYGKLITSEIICESKDMTKTDQSKYSNHIIVDGFCVSDCYQAAEFTKRLISYLPNVYHRFLDAGVNKRIQNFRIVHCHKTDDNRVKRAVSGDPDRAFISDVSGCETLPNIINTANIAQVHIQVHPDDVNAILAKCTDLDDHRYKFNRGGVFVFTRLRPSDCEFCKRRHDTDNTLIVSTQTHGGTISIFKMCRRYLQENGKNGFYKSKIGEIVSAVAPVGKIPDTSSWIDIIIQRSIQDLVEGKELFPKRLLFDELAPEMKNVYSEPQLRPLELAKTLIVHAAMKMGKTKALGDYLVKHFSAGLRPPIIRFISFRQTFSNNIKEKFSDFTMYSDVKGPLNQSKLIVQVESLYRLEITEGNEAPDLLILDECESIFEQFESGLLRGNFTECFAKFQYLLKYSKHTICMDANISDRTFNILKQMRPECDGTMYHCNQYMNAIDDEYFITGDKVKWLALLYSCIEADERIAVPMSSLTEAKAILRNLTKKYPAKRFKLYSSETVMSEKREHFSDVNAYWSQFDVLIYTPTISAGVSFEQKHFTKVFGYFTDQSCPVETCSQMIGRIRDIADHKLYICLAARGGNLPTDIDAIKQNLYDRRENLVKGFDGTGLRAEYGPNGKVTYYSGDYFQMWLENARIRNISKNSFVRRFIHIASKCGAQIAYLSDEIFEANSGMQVCVDNKLNDELAEIQLAHSIARCEIHSDLCRNIANSRELCEDEIEAYQSAVAAQKDITNEQRWAYEKYRLRADYHYEHEIDEKFVDKYRNPKVKRIFKNITRLGRDEPDAAWTQIQAEERANHKYIMDLGEHSQHLDLNRKYVFDQHRYALGLLKLCGWMGINDPQFIHKILIEQNLRAGESLYWDNIKAACMEFNIRIPKMARGDIISMLPPINKILTIMYGISIIERKIDPNMFFLNHSITFTTDPESSRIKRIPLIVAAEKAIGFDAVD